MHAGIRTHGSLSPLPDYTELRAGSLTVMYESGFIRYIRSGAHEVVRMVNHYLRDRNWNTIPMRIHNERIEREVDSFRVSYLASINHEDIHFSWQCSITGRSDETIHFEIEGEAQSDFLRNRLGFTVLLPTGSVRGQTCRITHPDTSTDELLFPDSISPHQPFLDIQSMAWSPAAGLQAVVGFSGDVFEMEDQRNWMDASHKVYCTPLKLGFPQQVTKGDRILQTVHIKVFGDLHHDIDQEGDITFSIDEQKGMRFPSVGIPLSEVPVTQRQREYMLALAPDFVSVVIKPHHDINLRITKALQFGRPLEIMLFPGTSAPEPVVLALKPHATQIARVVLLVEGKKAAPAALVMAFSPLLRKHLPKATMGSGTDAFFTELNRNPTPSGALDFLSFSVNPQTHASDLRTMTENLVAHRDVVESCRALADGRDVRVGPVTLKMRWNPDATTHDKPLPGMLPTNVDTRQPSLYAAGWALGSLKYLTESSASVATFFEMAGWRGLMSHPDERWPADFGVYEEAAYPVFLMLQILFSHRSSVVLTLVSSDCLRLDGMAFRDGVALTAVVANYSRESLNVVVPPSLVGSKVFVVSSENVEELLDRPLREPALDARIDDRLTIPAFGFALLRAEGRKEIH